MLQVSTPLGWVQSVPEHAIISNNLTHILYRDSYALSGGIFLYPNLTECLHHMSGFNV